MSATFAQAKKGVIDILTKPPIHQINFWCGMHVTSALLVEVEQAIESGKIKVMLLPGSLLDGADAEYFPQATKDVPEKNVLGIDENVGPDDFSNVLRLRCLVVHESVHAIADIKKLPINQLSSEAAGHLAAALYRVMSGQSIPSSESRYDTNDKAEIKVWKKCDEIIDTYKLRQGTAMVTTDDLNELRMLIHACNQYSGVALTKQQVVDGL